MIGRCSFQEKLGTLPSTPLMSGKSGSSEKYNRLVPPKRPDILETSKRHGEFNEPESRKYIKVKKKKVKSLGEVLMEAEKVEARREPVLNKRKRVTGSGHNFKSKLAKRTKGTTPEKSRVSQVERIPSYQETETSSSDDHCPLIQRLAYMKTIKASAQEEGYENQTLLKRKQASQDNNRQESFRAEHCAKEILSPKKWPIKETGAGNEIEKNSARAEGCESRILSKKNQALTHEGAENVIGKDCARAECFEDQTRLMKKQAMKDRGSGNEIIIDSAREEHYEKQASQNRQAMKDIYLGTDIVKDSSREKHYENQMNSKKKLAAQHQGTGDEIEKDSVAGEEHQENLITSEKKQGVKDKGTRKESEKDSSREDHCENQILPQKKQAVNARGAGKQIEKDSSRKECSENQILSQKKQAVSDDGVDGLINTLQKNCDKRMRKLIKKQQQEVQELQQSWEEKISELMKERELELAIIHSLHKKNSARIADKVKLLDVKFAKKMEEFNNLKDVQLKDLVTDHLAAIKQEREKQDGWLARAKPCQSSELKGVCGPESSGSKSEKVCGFPQPSTQDVVPITMHNVVDKIPSKSFRGNDVTMSEDSVSTDLQNDVHAPLDLSLSDHSSNRGFDDGDRTGLSGALVNQRDETDQTTTGGSSPIFGQMLETMELQASEDEIFQGATVIEDEGAQVVEKQETPPVEEDASEHIDNVEDRVTLQIEVDNTEIVDSANPLQDEGAQLREKQNSSDHVDSVTLLPSNIELSSKPSDKGIDLGDAIGFPDALVNPGDETNEATMGCLPLLEQQLLEPSEPLVLEDAIPHGSTSAVIQYHSAQVVEEQNTSLLNRNAPVAEDQVANKEVVIPVQGEGAQVVENQCTSDNVDTVIKLPSNIDVQDQEPIEEEQFALQIEPGNCEPVDTVNPVQCDDALLNYNGDELQIEQGNCEPVDIVNPVQCDNALLIDNGDKLHIGSSDETLCNQPTSIEAKNKSQNAEKNCLQIAQMEETELVPQECFPQSESNEELLSNIELLTSSHNTIDFILQDGLQPGSLEHLYGPSYLVPDPNHQVASWKSLPLYAVPFQKELERINAETERLKKSHEDLVSQLNSDCNKEILEMISQINKKYKLKHQDAEAEFSSKKNVLEKNHKKVLQSKLFAEVLGYTCLGLCSIGLPGLHQAPVPSCMQNQPLQHSMSPPPVASNPGEPSRSPLIVGWNMMRPPPVATSNQPATSTPIPGPNSRAMQHQPLQHLLRPCSMATYPGQPAPGPQLAVSNLQSMQQLLLPSQNFAPSGIQTAQRAAAPGSCSSTSRPPVIGSITPSVGNPHSVGGIHSMPPHLRSSRPATTATTSPPVIQHLPPLPAFQNIPQVQGGPTGQSNLLDPSVMDPSVGHPHSGGGIHSIPPHLHSSRPTTTSSPVSQHLPPPPAFKNMPQVQSNLLDPLVMDPSVVHPHSSGGIHSIPPHLHSSSLTTTSPPVSQHLPPPPAFKNMPQVNSNLLDPLLMDPSVGHPHSGGGIHSIPPHLPSSSPPTTFPPVTQYLPPPPAFQNMPQVQSNLLDTSVMDLLLDIEDLMDTTSEQSHWARQRHCSVQGYPTTSDAVPPDPICLSDED